MRQALRRPRTWALLLLTLILVLALRRWVHHAQIESMSVIVPDDVSATDVAHPSPGRLLQRMTLDVQDIMSRPQRPRLAVLTFDDGPYPVTTPLLLAQLQALHAPAVFFFIGDDARRQPAIAQRAAIPGIEIANHTLTHPQLVGMSVADQAIEVTEGASTIAQVSARATRYFRPPHGNYDAATIEAARGAHQTVALWDVDPGDWRMLTADQIVSSVRTHARAPAVILLHNGKQATIEALPRIVAAYRQAGFTFVTLSELQRRVPLAAINDPERLSI
ncbi:MAG: polysaccharide deacetylase family protein [Candidatus Eremiobacteraeota bacterium]|nr:polysaccharide deacetylase family protein [Candidatus Eremiobacteraeota bacterium]